MKSLLIGCGNSRDRQISAPGREWDEVVTLDHDPLCEPDVLWDMEITPLPFGDNSMDEIHAYEVLEHVGRQGDWKFFFRQWEDFYRILRPNGLFYLSVPAPGSVWVWGDPSHTRHLPPECFGFLSQLFYEQVGKTPATDFRSVWKGDFAAVHSQIKGERFYLVLQAKKPARTIPKDKPDEEAKEPQEPQAPEVECIDQAL
jgi:SAM-dependent methyltransferase